MQQRTLIRDAIIWRGTDTRPRGVTENLLIEGNRILAVGPDVASADAQTVIDAKGGLVMPGLVNAHFHSPVNHMKGRLPSLPLEIFMLYESPALDVLRPSPREAYVRTLLACLEMLRTGVTAVQDDAFFVPYPTPEIIDAVMQAYADSGLRARVALDQSDLPDIDKLPFVEQITDSRIRALLAEPPSLPAEGLLRAYDHLISRWHGAEDGRLQAAVSCSAPQRVTPGYAAALADLSKRYDLPFYVHILETKIQRHLGQERFEGRSLVRLAADLGILSERANIIHAIWVDNSDLDLIAASGASIAHNPISNLRLGSGVMPFRAIRDKGISIALGTDEAIADDAVNMWAVAKMAGLIHNIGQPDYALWPQADEILDCLIAGGHRAMRTEQDCGQIAPGFKADLILLDFDTLAFTPLNDLARQLVYCENGSSVRMTMVDGRILYDGNRVTTVNEAALRQEARAIAEAQVVALEEASRAADRLLPAFRKLYLTSAQGNVGMNRWVGGQG